jgi:chromosomal replication initiator protein
MEALWSAALPLLRQQLGERNFSAWIEPIHCRGSGEEIRLEVPSRFFQHWVTRHFLAYIRDTLAQLSGVNPQVRLVVTSNGEAAPRTPNPPASLEAPAPRATRTPRIGRIVPHYTFETFVVGAANEVAFKAARAIAEAPGRRFNPVFLHGGVGLGKTHLINAVAHHLLRPSTRLRVACLSAESFMNSLIGSLRQDQMNAFRERFRQVDALILDDVQFLAGKERTQEEFFHTFNALYGAEKQIVLTSDKRPAAISGLERRLRSRFEGGLIADIHPPTRELRQAILRAKAGRLAMDLSDEVVEELVKRSGPSVRELEGALNRVLASAAVRETAITRELVEAALGPLMRASAVSIEAVQEAVGGRFDVSVADLVSHRRTRQVSFPRQVAMYLSRTVAEASLTAIGEKFGGRDHTSVMYAVKAIESRRGKDVQVDQILAGIEGQLRDSTAA